MRCAALIDLLARARDALAAGQSTKADALLAAALALAPYIALEAME